MPERQRVSQSGVGKAKLGKWPVIHHIRLDNHRPEASFGRYCDDKGLCMATGENPVTRLTGSQRHFWDEFEGIFPNETALAAAAIALRAEEIRPLSDQEVALIRRMQTSASSFSKATLSRLREMILAGLDPLGEAFCALRRPEERRASGATYTPSPIVNAMVGWAATQRVPGRIVDPGVGSGRFLMRAAQSFPKAELVGIDLDPLAALIARANLSAADLARRSRIVVSDYRSFTQRAPVSTLYIGNPPYVRHHQISAKWKDWLFDEAAKLGHNASKLAGLHVHFFLATAKNGCPGDFGAFITAAEWLNVNYGSLVRSLILKELGGQSITVIEPTAQPFPDAATTAAITTFEIASKPTSLYFRRIDTLRALDGLNKGRKVHRVRLSSQSRWSCLTRTTERVPEGYVELGELFRVHRGQVTGANDVWIAGDHSQGLPQSVLFPSITRAREVFAAEGLLDDASQLRRVIDLPIDLDELERNDRRAVEKFLKVAKEMGGDLGYIARHRKAWWSVGLKLPAPIISTYMARRPPAFVVNRAEARHINVAHGLYPRISLTAIQQTTLVRFMQTNISQESGRTYAGGLTKFEPREMERLIVPNPEMLGAGVVV
jgi:adenine-specific DNA-methyltransferase